MSDAPEGVCALTAQQKLDLAQALMAREHRTRDGRGAFRAAYPEVAEEMIGTAAHHVYTDGAPALVAFLADAELFLRDPSHRMHLGVTYEVLYHIYNWMQFRELLPDGRKNLLELLDELKQFVAEDDRKAIVATATQIEDALNGSRDYPDFE
jgi:hypothetical protein